MEEIYLYDGAYLYDNVYLPLSWLHIYLAWGSVKRKPDNRDRRERKIGEGKLTRFAFWLHTFCAYFNHTWIVLQYNVIVRSEWSSKVLLRIEFMLIEDIRLQISVGRIAIESEDCDTIFSSESEVNVDWALFFYAIISDKLRNKVDDLRFKVIAVWRVLGINNHKPIIVLRFHFGLIVQSYLITAQLMSLGFNTFNILLIIQRHFIPSVIIIYSTLLSTTRSNKNHNKYLFPLERFWWDSDRRKHQHLCTNNQWRKN